MSSFDWLEIADEVKQLLDEVGFSATLKHTPKVVSVSSSSVFSGDPVTCAYKCVADNANAKTLERLDAKVSLDDLKLSDCKMLYAAPDVNAVSIILPKFGDIFDIGDGKNWSIIGISKIAPGNVDLLYVVGVVMQ